VAGVALLEHEDRLAHPTRACGALEFFCLQMQWQSPLPDTTYFLV
jgi:hypothetical protein